MKTITIDLTKAREHDTDQAIRAKIARNLRLSYDPAIARASKLFGVEPCMVSESQRQVALQAISELRLQKCPR